VYEEEILTLDKDLSVRLARILLGTVLLDLLRVLVLRDVIISACELPTAKKKKNTMSDGRRTVFHAFPASTSPAPAMCEMRSVSDDDA
jgi:hypothetical protein